MFVQLVHSAGRAGEAKLRQGDVVVQFLEDDLDVLSDLRRGVFGFQQIAGEQSAGRVACRRCGT
jgi:hypothetical protein